MRIAKFTGAIIVLLIIAYSTNRAINISKTKKIDSRIDNQGYWTRLAAEGIVPYNPNIRVNEAIYTGSKIKASTVLTLDSPDVPVTEINSIQSENSVFINPLDETMVINSNNSASNPLDTAYGANEFHTYNSGITWDGEIEGAGEDNRGDPSATIGLNGRWYINYIDENGGMGVSFSDNHGLTWTTRNATPNPALDCDKNHMWIDNNTNSPYEGRLYIAWTNFSYYHLGEIGISYSTDHGETWNLNTNISSEVNAGSHNQGVNISTGPDGEVYAVWAIYDEWNYYGSDEVAIGMAKSFDGGETWEPSVRIIDNIKGIRGSKTKKDLRVNSFPVATVDNSNSADRGAIYVTWTNIGTPGINEGEDIDIYMIKSIDKGNTWSQPKRVNGDSQGLGNEHFMQWITCDPTNGILSMIYYDDRNTNDTDCEVYCANSVDGGQTWEEFKVSDVSFTPSPIPGLADNYMGDYLGIHAKNGVVYPIWTDNRLGYAMSFCSPYQTNVVNRPYNLEGDLFFETGALQLTWSYDIAPEFTHFVIYRDYDSVGFTNDTSYTDILPHYGLYRYRVTARYQGDIESGATGISIQWGSPKIFTNTDSIYAHVAIGKQEQKHLPIINQGQLSLNYTLSLGTNNNKTRDYCQASGGGGIGNEFISGVQVGDINNVNTGSDNYTFYSQMSTLMEVGNSYQIIVTNENPYDLDQCGVWIDWNINGIFEESELTVLDGATLSPIFSGNIVPPPGAVTGTTRMRVRLTYSGTLNPCGNTTFGEVEDYTIITHGWIDLSSISDTISPGDTSNIIINFNGTDLPPKDFFTTLYINSNDPDTETIEIPVHARTDHLVANAIAVPSEICSGYLVELRGEVSGIFDSVSYRWSSIPEGFVSEKARTFAKISEPTWYKLKIFENDHYSYDSVFVDVLPSPSVSLGNDTTLCADETITLDGGDNAISYLWSTGDTSKYLDIDTLGFGFGIQTIIVEATNDIGCISSGNIRINFINCTDINEIKESKIKIFPNPNDGVFYIDLFDNNGKYFDLKIINSAGYVIYYQQKLIVSKNNPSEVRVKNLMPGTYFVIIELDGSMYREKLIISD